MQGQNNLRIASLSQGKIGNLPQQDNAIVHSQTRHFAHNFHKPTLSFKYVINGQENYRIDGKTYCLQARQYLLVNDERNYFGESHEKSAIEEGLCIYLNMSLLNDVKQTLQNSEDYLLTNSLADYQSKPEFLEKIYHAEESELGSFIYNIARQIAENPQSDLPNHWDFYYTLAEKLLIQQNKVFNQINRLKTAKSATRQELYRRLEIARNYMAQNYSQKLDIEAVARTAAISEYHFFRSFKQVYGISPYQYLLKIRLEKAVDLLKNARCSVTETAYLIGFSDIHSFSKSFKKEYRLSPLEVLQQNTKSIIAMCN
ncbi:MAG: AraC family transcriptional regulator [Microscillaceae bacterium]|jgi:AraC-like DNA-binding protein|nr:AraC family transcriptional regulator [Microscillaceae bacterium]